MSLIVETVPPLKTLLWYSLPYDVSCFDDATSSLTPDPPLKVSGSALLILLHPSSPPSSLVSHCQVLSQTKKWPAWNFSKITFSRSFWFI